MYFILVPITVPVQKEELASLATVTLRYNYSIILYTMLHHISLPEICGPECFGLNLPPF
jgi:hypothetical protein